MSWAFWRRTAPDPAIARDAASGAEARAELVLALRARARRRLIGAAALLLIAVVVVPMILDPTPRPLPDAIPIDIPSEKTPFTPRLALPPVTESPAAPAAPADSMAASEPEKSGGTAATGTDSATAAVTSEAPVRTVPAPSATDAAATIDSATAGAADKRDRRKRTARKAEEARARAALEGKAVDDVVATASAPIKTTAGGHYALQAAALGSETAARELSDRLGKAGFQPFTEKIDTKDGPRFRVRVGPYGSRDDAERERARLRALGVNGDLVRV